MLKRGWLAEQIAAEAATPSELSPEMRGNLGLTAAPRDDAALVNAAADAKLEGIGLGCSQMTPEHDADIAYYESEVRHSRKASLNREEWPQLDAEVRRLGEVRSLIQSLAAADRETEET